MSEAARAVVTGGGTGIGEAFAGELARRGHEVWLVGRRAAPLAAAAAAIQAAGGAARAWPGDVVDRAAMDRLARELRGGPPLRVLVNNAAILGPVATLAETHPDAFSPVLRVNVEGVFHCTQALLPLLLAAGPGAQVINLSSGVGRQGRAGWGAYAASKFAVEGLTQVWADELGPRGLRVNAFNPGGTRTSMRAAAKPKEDPRTLPTPQDLLPALRALLDGTLNGASIDARDWIRSSP